MLRLDFCDYSDAYTVAKGTTITEGGDNRDKKIGF